jgi:hypothetical protein
MKSKEEAQDSVFSHQASLLHRVSGYLNLTLIPGSPSVMPSWIPMAITPLGYTWQEERVLRCNNLRDLIFSSCQRGCLHPAREKVGSLLSQRPDDMTSTRRRPGCYPLAVPPQLISPLCRPSGWMSWGRWVGPRLGCLSVHGLPEERP